MMGFGSFRLSDLAFSLLSDPDYDIFHNHEPVMITILFHANGKNKSTQPKIHSSERI